MLKVLSHREEHLFGIVIEAIMLSRFSFSRKNFKTTKLYFS